MFDNKQKETDARMTKLEALVNSLKNTIQEPPVDPEILVVPDDAPTPHPTSQSKGIKFEKQKLSIDILAY